MVGDITAEVDDIARRIVCKRMNDIRRSEQPDNHWLDFYERWPATLEGQTHYRRLARKYIFLNRLKSYGHATI